MRQNHLLIKRCLFFTFMAIWSCFEMRADKVWVNNSSITEPSAFAPVVDENLYIEGTNRLVGGIHIAAISADVIVSVSGVSSAVTTSDSLAPAELYIYANNGQTVTFNITEDFQFSGSTQDLLVTFSGQGNLIFNVAGDSQLSFTSNPQEHGVKFLVNMDSFVHAPNNEYSVLFSRFPLGSLGAGEQDENAFVTIGANSMIGFIAPAVGSLQNGIIAFDPSNSSDHLGRLILQIGNGGAFNIQGRLNNAGTGNGFGNITLADIDLATFAGSSSTATFSIINSNGPTAWSGLLVVNGNTQWSQLQSNPWCEPVISATPVGFVLGSNGVFTVNDNTYLDYVGTVTNYTYDPNVDPDVLEARELEGVPTFNFVKDRNPSAFIIDGSSDAYAFPRATIIMNGDSAMYFRSGVDRDGMVTFSVFDPILGESVISFTVAPNDTEHGAAGYGEIVLDVEGPVNIIGSQDTGGENVLNILSIQVSQTGGSVFIESPQTTFPLRTYNRDDNGAYLQYNTACFMVNNRMNFFNASLQHTDELHRIYDQNFPLQSEASYIGGESWLLCADRPRPKIALYDSQILFHTSAAFTGVDIFTPEFEGDEGAPGNNSLLKFYYNGRAIDQGTGRELVLGTNIGGLASDLNTVINRDAHLDIYQEFAQIPGLPQLLSLVVAPNNHKVVELLPADQNAILNQFSIQTIFLGHNSNISIGTNGVVGVDPILSTSFVLTTSPELFINGDFFSFQTQGGDTNTPDASMTTGQGGMFVDTNGVVQISSNYRANIGMMVTKSRNASIDLPKRQVFFDPTVGIAQWRLDLTDPTQRLLIAATEVLSDYTLDWANIIKDYSLTDTVGVFVPYEPPNTPPACQAPPITPENLIGIPVIQGTVDQMQILNSRLGDQAHLLIDGGTVRELVMLTGHSSADAPVGVIFMQNNAELGLGTAHRNIDSDYAQVVLGLNGIILVANGDCQVLLNEDVLINNVCPMLTGTAFGQFEKEELFITSVVPREIRVTSEGYLDLSAFTQPNQELVIGGEVKLVFEPGARLIMGGGKLRIAENAQVQFQPYLESNPVPGTSLTSTDNFRVRWTGSGNLIMSENAQMFIPRGAYVGLESAGFLAVEDQIGEDQVPDVVINCSYITSQTWTIRDSAQIHLGTPEDFGGSLQIGNTMNLTGSGANIDLTIIMNGIGTLLDINSQGFLGLGVGIVDKPEDVPDTWLVDTTFNVSNVTFQLIQGTLRASQIAPGSNKLAGLFAIGAVDTLNLTFDNTNVDILGGGNMVLLNSAGPVNPIVDEVDGGITPQLSVGILASTPMLADPSKVGLFNNPFTPVTLFNYLKMNEYDQQSTKLATIAQTTLGSPTSGYVDQGAIVRDINFRIQGLNTVVDSVRSVEEGAVGIALDRVLRTPTYYEVVL